MLHKGRSGFVFVAFVLVIALVFALYAQNIGGLRTCIDAYFQGIAYSLHGNSPDALSIGLFLVPIGITLLAFLLLYITIKIVGGALWSIAKDSRRKRKQRNTPIPPSEQGINDFTDLEPLHKRYK